MARATLPLVKEKRREVATIVGWLGKRDDAENLVKALRPLFSRPNLKMQISAAAVSEEFAHDVNETFKINEMSAGTPVVGSGSVDGKVTAPLASCDGMGAIALNLEARMLATTTGSNGDVRVKSTSRANIAAEKIILVEQTGLLDLPATADARARVDFDSIRTPGGIYGRHALREVYGSRPRAESETESSSALSARTHLDADAKKPVADVNDAFRGNVLYPLAACGAWPRIVESKANRRCLQVDVVQSNGDEWGPDTPPLAAPADADAALEVHATMIERTANLGLRGRRFTGQELARQFTPAASSSAAEKGVRSDGEPEESPWSLTFSNDEPASVQIKDDELHVTLRLREFESDGTIHPGMEVNLVYALSAGDGAAHFRQVHPPVSLPLRFSPGGGRHLSGPQQVVCNILNRRLSRMIGPEYLLRSLFPNGSFVRLHVSAGQARRGWLLIAMTSRDVASDGNRSAARTSR